jgi:CRISPR-associated protein Csh2
MPLLEDRSELLFVFDATGINPNGDPLNENKPRMDEETGHCLVSDVRLKRTIRDYLSDHKGEEIFVREVRKEDGNLATKEEIVRESYGTNSDTILDKCVDIRLFGATLAIGGAGSDQRPITFTGPVQFRMGRSLHRVGEPQFHQGNTVMPSGADRTRGTFRDEYLLPYGLFGFYGVVNQKAGEKTKLQAEDVPLLIDGLWNGTKNLITRSKVGQMPRLLIQVTYSEPYYLMGELDKRIKVKTDLREEELRDVSQLHLDISSLVADLKKKEEKVKIIRGEEDSRLKLLLDGKVVSLSEAFKDLPYEPFNL